jgi:carboxyl-terminal processing protease
MTLQQAVERIRGPRGSKVRLTVLHDGDSNPVDVDVARGEIKTASVASRMLDEGYAYIRIAQVTQRSADELKAQIDDLLKSNPKGVILDLRDDPGGVLDTTIDLASQFMKDGVVLTSIDSNGKKETYNVRPGGKMTDLPMVVLVNKGSASASEVMSGALQDTKRAKIIGEVTYGKGTVNIMRELSNHGAVYVSIARWYTPNGQQIHGKGITPDIQISLTDDDIKNKNDSQLKRAIEYLQTGQ